MKNFSFLLCMSLAMLASWAVQAQAPQGLNYQAVMRDAQGQTLANEPLTLTFEILEGSPSGPVTYSEDQSLSTNPLGLVTAVIGSGASSGQLSDVDWSSGDHFLRVSLDLGSGPVSLGTTQLLSVPYALFAESVANVDDADADPTNELQTLTLSGSNLQISNGNAVDLTGVISDVDSTNELQDLNLNGTFLEISGGNGADLASLVDDADADPTNELQNVAFSGTTLSLSNGGSVNLGSLINDADANPNNELQNLSFSGTTLAISSGNSVNLSGLINDADANPNNELQNLSFSGSNLSISSGNSIDLSTLEGTLADYAFATGSGSTPNSSKQFLVNPASITISSSSQKVVIISHGLLGNSNVFNASDDLDLYIGFRLTGTTGTVNVVSPGMLNVRLSANERQSFGLSAVLTNLVPGTYDFGLAGDDDGNGNWNANGPGYTTVLLFN